MELLPLSFLRARPDDEFTVASVGAGLDPPLPTIIDISNGRVKTRPYGERGGAEGLRESVTGLSSGVTTTDHPRANYLRALPAIAR